MSVKSMPVYDIESFIYRGTPGGLYANMLSLHIRQHAHIVFTPHRHTSYMALLFTKGSGRHEVDFHSYDIKPGTVLLLSPGQIHYCERLRDVEGYVFFHTREFYNLNFAHEKVENYPFFNDVSNTSSMRLSKEATMQAERIFSMIVEEYQGEALMKHEKLCSLISLLYIDLSRIYLPAERKKQHRERQVAQVRKLEMLIEKNFTTMKSAAQYAKIMFMSQKNLNRICKLILNKTTSEVIYDRIILEAKRLLIYSNLSVLEISNELGYQDDSYFIRLFKKKTGMTPLEFSRKYRTE